MRTCKTIKEVKDINEAGNLKAYIDNMPEPIDPEINRAIRFSTTKDKVGITQKAMRRNIYDHLDYSVFLDSTFG